MLDGSARYLARTLVLLLLLGAAGFAFADCPVVPEPIGQVRSTNIYGDHAILGSGVDQAASARREELVRPISDYLGTVARQADAYHKVRDLEAARCALDALARWAHAGALLETPSNEAAHKDRIWNTAGLALAYLRIRPAATKEQTTAIEAWLRQLGDKVAGRYGRSKRKDNVHAWAGLVGIAVGACCAQLGLLETGVQMLASVLSGVNVDGHLEVEAERGARALAYHHFATAPMLVGAVIASRHGRPLSGTSADALRRLTEFTLRATANRLLLERLTGRKQDDPSARMQAVVVALSGTATRAAEDRTVAFERWFGGNAAYFAD